MLDCDWTFDVYSLVPRKSPVDGTFLYRYAMILLPWMFLLLTGNGPPKITVTETSLFAVSVVINAIATWLFIVDRQNPAVARTSPRRRVAGFTGS